MVTGVRYHGERHRCAGRIKRGTRIGKNIAVVRQDQKVVRTGLLGVGCRHGSCGTGGNCHRLILGRGVSADRLEGECICSRIQADRRATADIIITQYSPLCARADGALRRDGHTDCAASRLRRGDRKRLCGLNIQIAGIVSECAGEEVDIYLARRK